MTRVAAPTNIWDRGLDHVRGRSAVRDRDPIKMGSLD